MGNSIRPRQKSALITGVSRGIGRSIAETFAKEGAQVTPCGRQTRTSDLSSSIDWISLDVRDVSVVEKLSQKISSLHILVNNAGVQIEKQIPESIEEDWENVIGTNAKGVFNVCRAIIPVMSTGDQSSTSDQFLVG